MYLVDPVTDLNACRDRMDELAGNHRFKSLLANKTFEIRFPQGIAGFVLLIKRPLSTRITTPTSEQLAWEAFGGEEGESLGRMRGHKVR